MLLTASSILLWATNPKDFNGLMADNTVQVGGFDWLTPVTTFEASESRAVMADSCQRNLY